MIEIMRGVASTGLRLQIEVIDRWRLTLHWGAAITVVRLNFFVGADS